MSQIATFLLGLSLFAFAIIWLWSSFVLRVLKALLRAIIR